MSENMEPCPFCGSNAEGPYEYETPWPGERSRHSVDCSVCSCRITDDGKDRAVERWNKRTPDITAANERIRKYEQRIIGVGEVAINSVGRDAYEGCREDLLYWEKRAQKAEAAYTAERGISDKLEKALKKALDSALRAMQLSSYHPDKTYPMDVMSAAISDVAAIRKGETA